MFQMAHTIQSGSKKSATGHSTGRVMKELQAAVHGTRVNKMVLYTKLLYKQGSVRVTLPPK